MDKTLQAALIRDWDRLSDEDKEGLEIEQFVESWTDQLVTSNLPEFKLRCLQSSKETEASERQFANEMVEQYASAFDSLSLFVEYCCSVGERCFVNQDLSSLQYVLGRSHAKSCLVAREILLLLKQGYAEAAVSRWRTLFEVNVISKFIEMHGDECATLFIEHLEIDLMKYIRERNECSEKLGWAAVSESEFNEQQLKYEQLKEKYGKNFAKGYGWASSFIGLGNPNFKDLSKAAGFEHWFTVYKTSSYSVHSSYVGLLSTNAIGRINEEMLLAGQSALGLVNPAQWMAISFKQVTTRLLLNMDAPELLADVKALGLLLDETVKILVKGLPHDTQKV